MKTTLIMWLALVMSTAMLGQVIKSKEEIAKINKDLKEQSTRIEAVKKLLESEQAFLQKGSGNTELNTKSITNITAYTKERDDLTKAIEANKKLIMESKSEDMKKLADKEPSEKKRAKLEADAIKTKYKTDDENSVLTDKNKAAPNEAKYTFLNGLNFDFTSENKTNYVGHFNIYVPATETNRWAINTGIMKISYLPKDSIVVSKAENVLINPLDIIDGTGDTYNQKYNRYSTQTKASAFSLYIQPMYHLTKLGCANIYLHVHFELLMSKYETKTKIKTLQTQEVTLADGDPIPSESNFIKVLPSETSKTVDLNTGNFGLGTTYDFNFRDNCVLFIQTTVGFSLNHANDFPTIDADGNYSIATSEKSQKFYLVRTYFKYFTSSATQLVLGTDIRGYFPKQSPYTSIYIGINLGLDKIFSM
jgi:hypothetical protein